MGTSSHRVGPTYDTLTVSIQPWPSRTTYSVVRLHHDGAQTTRIREASGVLAITAQDLETVTALGLLERLTDAMRSQAKPPPPLEGDTGVEPTLDLYFTP